MVIHKPFLTTRKSYQFTHAPTQGTRQGEYIISSWLVLSTLRAEPVDVKVQFGQGKVVEVKVDPVKGAQIAVQQDGPVLVTFPEPGVTEDSPLSAEIREAWLASDMFGID